MTIICYENNLILVVTAVQIMNDSKLRCKAQKFHFYGTNSLTLSAINALNSPVTMLKKDFSSHYCHYFL